MKIFTEGVFLPQSRHVNINYLTQRNIAKSFCAEYFLFAHYITCDCEKLSRRAIRKTLLKKISILLVQFFTKSPNVLRNAETVDCERCKCSTFCTNLHNDVSENNMYSNPVGRLCKQQLFLVNINSQGHYFLFTDLFLYY